MMRLAIFCLCAALAWGCDRKGPPPTPTPTPPAGSEPISGSERIGWDQSAPTGAELASFRYLVYVDARDGVELQDVTCAPVPGAGGFPCTARLPALTAGAHSLALSAFIESGGRLESGRSTPLSVFVLGQSVAGEPPPIEGVIPLVTTDGVRLRASVAALGLDDPTDLVALPDGRLLVAERAGIVRIVAMNAMQTTPAAVFEDVRREGDQGLLALAVDTEFARNGFVYAAYTARDGLRVVRLRATGNRLQEGIVLMEAIAPPHVGASAALNVGRDRTLYIAVDDGGSRALADDPGSFSGKVLRVNRDATTPADHPMGSPVFAPGLHAPRAMAWTPAADFFWVLDAGLISLVRGGPPTGAGGSIAARYALPPPMRGADLAVYTDEAITAFAGDLFVADDGNGSLLRLRVDKARPRTIVGSEQLLAGRITSARAVAVAPDGAIYLCTADALIRIAR